MLSLSGEKHANFIEGFNSTSRYLDDDSPNIDNDYFEQMLYKLYPKELHVIELIPQIPKHRFWI